MMRYTRTQHRPASRQVNDHGRVSGTHTPAGNYMAATGQNLMAADTPVGAQYSVVGADQG